MTLPPLASRSQDLLMAERSRVDADETTDADALLARIRHTVVVKSLARTSSRRSRRFFLLAAAAALLLVAGLALAGYLRSRRPVPLVPPAAPSPAQGPTTLPEPAPRMPPESPPPAAAATAVGSAAVKRAAPPPPTASSVDDTRTMELDASEEAALIARAGDALAAGSAEDALRLLQLHERKFQHPRLTEQREVLFVRSLVAAQRTTEARQRFVRLTKAYPSSPETDSLQRLVGE